MRWLCVAIAACLLTGLPPAQAQNATPTSIPTHHQPTNGLRVVVQGDWVYFVDTHGRVLYPYRDRYGLYPFGRPYIENTGRFHFGTRDPLFTPLRTPAEEVRIDPAQNRILHARAYPPGLFDEIELSHEDWLRIQGAMQTQRDDARRWWHSQRQVVVGLWDKAHARRAAGDLQAYQQIVARLTWLRNQGPGLNTAIPRLRNALPEHARKTFDQNIAALTGQISPSEKALFLR